MYLCRLIMLNGLKFRINICIGSHNSFSVSLEVNNIPVRLFSFSFRLSLFNVLVKMFVPYEDILCLLKCNLNKYIVHANFFLQNGIMKFLSLAVRFDAHVTEWIIEKQ